MFWQYALTYGIAALILGAIISSQCHPSPQVIEGKDYFAAFFLVTGFIALVSTFIALIWS